MSDVVLAAIASVAPRAAPRREFGRLALFAALFGASLVPVLTTPIPAMVDYVNHLARMYELAAAGTPDASIYYRVAWKLYPNLAMDLVVPQLAHWGIGVELATRLFLLAAQILVVTGSIAIEIAVARRFAVSGFVAVLYLYNVPFAWGFLNFEFALGVALWGVAAWLAIRERSWPMRFAVHTLFVATLFAAHLFALGLYGVAIGMHELRLVLGQARPGKPTLAAAALLGVPVALVLAIMVVTGGSVGGDPVNVWHGYGKPFWPLLLLNGDNAVVSIVGTVALGCLAHAMWRRGELAVAPSGLWIGAGLAALYVIVPGTLLDTAFVDVRVLAAAVFILPAFVTVSFVDRRSERLAAAVVAAVTLANVACIQWVWSSYQPVYGAMIASFGKLAPNSRVLVGHVGSVEDPPFRHLAEYPLHHAPTLAVHYAGAFVPTLFTTVGKQPLVVAPELRRLSFSCGGPIPLSLLRAIAQHDRRLTEVAPFLRDWPRDFDYVYLLGTPVGDPMPGVLDLVESQPNFAVYRVRKAVALAGRRDVSGPASP